MIPRPVARYYLENAPSLVVLIVLNLAGMLVGVRFYVESMPDIHTFLWPFYLDSAVALLLMAGSLLVVVANLGRPLEAVPQNRVLAVLHTLAFVWLVKYGLWTAVALTIGHQHYFPSLTDYWFLVITHLAFVIQAFLIPHYGTTSREALGIALALLLLNDLLDYGFGLHPPLRYDPGVGLVLITVGLSVGAVALAARTLDRVEDRTQDRQIDRSSAQ